MLQNVDNIDISVVNQNHPQCNENTSEKLITCLFDWTKETSTGTESNPRHNSKAKHEIWPQQCNLEDLFNLHFSDADNAAISKMLETDNVLVSIKNSGLDEFMTDIEWEPIWERFQAEPNDEDKKIDQ